MNLRSLLWLLALLLPFLLQAATPTVPASNFNPTFFDGNRINFSFTKGDGSRRVVIARAGSAVSSSPVNGVDYNHDSTFGDGDEIAPGEFVVSDHTGSSLAIFGLDPNTTYHFRIFEYNGTGAGTEYLLTALEGSASTVAAPDIQASGLNVSNPTGFSLDLNWTRGNGSQCIILAKAGSPVDANPSDLSSYTWNQYFGNGSQIGTGNRVVYQGTGTSITIQKLDPGITYHFAIYELNGSGGPVYLVPAHTASGTTATTPTLAASNLSFYTLDGNRMTFSWTQGNGARRLIIARAGSPVTAAPVDGQTYTANSDFGAGEEISSGEFVVYNNTGTSAQIYNFEPNQTYYFEIFEFNADGTGNTYYLTSPSLSGNAATAGPPLNGVSDISFSNISGTSLSISWTPGDGSGRLVLAKEAAAVDYSPTALENFAFGSNFSTAPVKGADNRVLYVGSGNSVNVSGLEPGVSYHFEVFEYNGSSGKVYRTPGTTASQITDDSPPSTASSNLSAGYQEGNSFTLYWTKGNGSRRLVVVNTGSPVTATPVDGMEYLADADLGEGDDLGGGQYVVYNNIGSTMTLRNLSPATTYYIRIYEYFGTGSHTIYQTALYGELTQATASPPTNSATMSFSNVTSNSMQVNFTDGNGVGRLVVARAGSAVDNSPNDLQSYSGTSSFGNNLYTLGSGNYIIYRGSSTSVNLTNLNPGVTYYFKTFEYNGQNAPVYEVGPADYSQTTPAVPPSTQTNNLNFTGIGANQLRLNWTNGNGSRRIVLARKNSAVDASPQDNNSYTANAAFGTGQEIGTGNFVVYDGTNTGVTITGLELETAYHFAIFEYNGVDLNTYFLRPGATASQSTIAPPGLAPSNLTISDVSGTSSQVGWTNGDGDGRLLVISEGAPLDSDPVPGQAYTSSANFSSSFSSSIGNGKVAYFSTGTTITVNGLDAGTTYYYYLFEYSGVSNSPNYLLSPATSTHTTPGPPQTAASNLTTSGNDGATVNISWTPGSGQKRIVIMRQDGATPTAPVDGQDYAPNSAFGAGSELGAGNFVVYEGNGNSAVITNLNPTTTYHLEVYEFNFENAGTRYLLTDPAMLTFSTTVLPVECLHFAGQLEAKQVRLQWTTATELNNAGFSLQRSTDGIRYTEIAWVPGEGTTSEPTTYQWLDILPPTGATFYYRLIQHDWDGQFEQACEIISLQAPTPETARLELSPNPFHAQLRLRFTMTEKNAVRISIHDLQGRALYQWKQEELPAGKQEFVWTGVQKNGEAVAPGIYFIRLEMGEKVWWRKINKQ